MSPAKQLVELAVSKCKALKLSSDNVSVIVCQFKGREAIDANSDENVLERFELPD